MLLLRVVFTGGWVRIVIQFAGCVWPNPILHPYKLPSTPVSTQHFKQFSDTTDRGLFPKNWWTSKQQQQPQQQQQQTNKPTNKPTNQPTKQPNNQTTKQPTNQTTKQPNKQTTNQPNNQTTKQPNNQTNKQPTSETTKQPNNQTTKQPNKQTNNQPTNQTNNKMQATPGHLNTRSHRYSWNMMKHPHSEPPALVDGPWSGCYDEGTMMVNKPSMGEGFPVLESSCSCYQPYEDGTYNN